MMRPMDNEERQILPHKEEIEVINLSDGEDKKEVKIGTLLSLSVKEEIVSLLREYANVFTWSYQDMPGLSTEIVEHKLPLKPECKPVQQKLRRMKPEMLLKIKEEVKK